MRKYHLCKTALILAIGFSLILAGMPSISEAQEQNSPATEAGESMPPTMDVVEVTDAASLLAAIQPNRTIKLLPGVYNISTLIANEATQSQQVYADYKDGEVTIRDVSNLALIADEPQEIYTENFHDTVLSFVNCSQISVSGISFGHHNQSEQQCFAGVMWLSGCSDFEFTGCDFYGCGYSGPTIFDCNSITFANCVIRDCSTTAVNIYNCSDIIFNHTEIFGICTDGHYPDWLFCISDSKSVSFNACSIHNNGCGKTGLTYSMFIVSQMDVTADDTVSMNDCAIDSNQYVVSFCKRLSTNVAGEVDTFWQLSQLLAGTDDPNAKQELQERKDKVFDQIIANNKTSIIQPDDSKTSILLVNASELVIKQLTAALENLRNDVPDLYQRVAAFGKIIFTQIDDSRVQQSLMYSDGMFFLHCTPKQEKSLGKKGLYDAIYYAFAKAAGMEVYLDAKSVTIQNGQSDVTGKTLDIDLATGTNTLQLSAAVLPVEAQQAVTWRSSNESVATVSDAGLVTAIKPGKATITATTADGTKKKASCKIKVIDTTK